MAITRRGFVTRALGAGCALGLAPTGSYASLLTSFAGEPATGATYLNPILPGDHPDAGAIRVGDDFYLTHSSFDYAPGLTIWHSRDLVNWKPAAAALKRYYGSVWAPYLCEHEGHFYIYFPSNLQLHVVHAASPLGPWSEPVNLKVDAIDPAHIAANGRRFLHYNGGYMLELAADGLSVKEPARRVFEPWTIPGDVRIECVCLEAPKVFKRGEYFYLTVAQGGTAGPATSHMVVSARSRNVDGPWEYSPYNPVVHTRSREERWRSMGHGRLVDVPDGSWWMTLHGYESGYLGLGRQTLLLPVEWTSDGWFRLPAGTSAEKPIKMMKSATGQLPRPDLSDDFAASTLGAQWQFWRAYDPERFQVGDGRLVLAASGKSVDDTSPLTCITGDHSYTIEVDVEIEGACDAGLLLFYNNEHACGVRLGPKGIGARHANGYTIDTEYKLTRTTLRIVNDRQEVDYYYRATGGQWTRTRESAEVSSLNHNVLGGFLDLRPALYACGAGKATFRNFRYRAGAV